mgnify:CR=1 FL=1|tara:strand:- start:113 stop:484 length:372 start_codon:yes stop_codon:yes gene_type:complete
MAVKEKTCPRCEITKPASEYFLRKSRKGGHLGSYCKKCCSQERVNRGKAFKQKCLDYKGGVCESCGYNKANSALEFHHINPEEKSFGFASQRRTKFDEAIKKELDKCMLLCSNCHREKHAGLL